MLNLKDTVGIAAVVSCWLWMAGAQACGQEQYSHLNKLSDVVVFRAQKYEAEDIPKKVWIGDKGRVGLASPDAAADKFKHAQPAEFMEMYSLVDCDEKNGYVLVGKPDNKDGNIPFKNLFGWVRKDVLVLKTTPLNSKGKERLYKKLKVINSRAYLEEAKRNGRLSETGVEIHKTVEQKDTQPELWKTADLFFVYAEATIGEKMLYLVGGEPNFRIGEGGAASIKGWLPADRASIWPDRFAAEWYWQNTDEAWCEDARKRREQLLTRQKNGGLLTSREKAIVNNQSYGERRTAPGKIFSLFKNSGSKVDDFDAERSKEAAFKFVQGELSESEVDESTGFREQFLSTNDSSADGLAVTDGKINAGFKSIPFRPKESRMVILERIESNEHPVIEIQADLLRVGWEGKFSGHEQREKIRRELQQIQELTDQIEVLVVIDRTGSMKHSFSSIATSMARIAAELIDNCPESRDVRVAFSFFGEKDGFPDVDCQELQSISNGNNRSEKVRTFLQAFLDAGTNEAQEDVVAKFQSQLKGIPVFESIKRVLTAKSGGGSVDLRENLFGGIKQSIDKARFSDSTLGSLQLVIVVGDSGDSSREVSARDTGLRKRVIRKIWAQGVENRFLRVIQYPNPQVPKNEYGEKTGYREFETQMKFVCDESPDVETEIQLASFATAGELQDIGNYVLEPIDLLLSKANQLAIELEQFVKGGDFHTEPGESLRKELNRRDPELLKSIKESGAQVYEEGYVWQRSVRERLESSNIIKAGQPQIRKKVLLAAGELDEIIEYLDGIVGERAGEKSFYQAAVTLVDQISGDKGNFRSIDEKFKAKLDLSFNSPILSMSKELLQDMDRGILEGTEEEKADRRKEMKELKGELLVKLHRLNDIKKKRAFRNYFFEEDPEYGHLVVKTVGDVQILDRSFTFGQAVELYYWIDYELEIP